MTGEEHSHIGRAGARMAAAAAFLALPVVAMAQFDMPKPKPLSGATLFTRQCATCHTLDAAGAPRQGPTLAGVYGRKAGSVKEFAYSPGFAKANWNWDFARLDAWLTDPRAMIPGSLMPYNQAKPEIRSAIIAYLKDQH